MKPLLDGRNGPDFDRPMLAVPPRTYIIASVPRSGSTLFARLLWETGQVGSPKEYLNPMQLRDWQVRLGSWGSKRLHARLRGRWMGAVVGRGWSLTGLDRHLEAVRLRRSSGGWFGLKLHHHHFLRYGGTEGIERLLPNARWLRIQREDRLGQALSWHRALDSGRWAAWQEDRRPARYSRARVADRLAAIDAAERGWDDALRGVPVCNVTYEQLVATPETTVRRALAWLDVADPSAVAIPAAPTHRQSDGVTASWRIRWASGA